MNAARVVCCVLFSFTTAWAADHTIVRGKEVPVTSLSTAVLIGPAECDEDGNVYLRPGTGLDAPLVKVSSDGQKITYFRPADAGIHDGRVFDYTITDRGDVFTNVEADQRNWLVEFNRSGEYVRRRAFQEDVEPIRIAAFRAGLFLINGWSGPAEARVSVQAVFDADARRVRGVKLPEGKNAPGGNVTSLERNTFLAGTTLKSGPDGNVYAVRGGGAGPVYAVSHTGDVIRTIAIPPRDGYRLSDVKLSRTSLLAVYTRLKKTSESDASTELPRLVFTEINLHSGEEAQRYTVADPWLSRLACYAPNQFRFVATDEHGMMILMDGVVK